MVDCHLRAVLQWWAGGLVGFVLLPLNCAVVWWLIDGFGFAIDVLVSHVSLVHFTGFAF